MAINRGESTSSWLTDSHGPWIDRSADATSDDLYRSFTLIWRAIGSGTSVTSHESLPALSRGSGNVSLLSVSEAVPAKGTVVHASLLHKIEPQRGIEYLLFFIGSWNMGAWDVGPTKNMPPLSPFSISFVSDHRRSPAHPSTILTAYNPETDGHDSPNSSDLQTRSDASKVERQEDSHSPVKVKAAHDDQKSHDVSATDALFMSKITMYWEQEIIPSIIRHFFGDDVYLQLGEDRCSSFHSHAPDQVPSQNQAYQRTSDSSSGAQQGSPDGGGSRDDRKGTDRSRTSGDGKGDRQRNTSSQAQITQKCDALLACPFHKTNPDKFRRTEDNKNGRKYQNCPKGFESIARLRDHLKKYHCPAVYCTRCAEVFDDQAELLQHNNRVPPCPSTRNSQFMDEYIMFDRHAALFDNNRKKRKSPTTTVEEEWFFYWKTIFPQKAPPASPYQDLGVEQVIHEAEDEAMPEILSMHSDLRDLRDDALEEAYRERFALVRTRIIERLESRMRSGMMLSRQTPIGVSSTVATTPSSASSTVSRATPVRQAPPALAARPPPPPVLDNAPPISQSLPDGPARNPDPSLPTYDSPSIPNIRSAVGRSDSPWSNYTVTGQGHHQVSSQQHPRPNYNVTQYPVHAHLRHLGFMQPGQGRHPPALMSNFFTPVSSRSHDTTNQTPNWVNNVHNHGPSLPHVSVNPPVPTSHVPQDLVEPILDVDWDQFTNLSSYHDLSSSARPQPQPPPPPPPPGPAPAAA